MKKGYMLTIEQENLMADLPKERREMLKAGMKMAYAQGLEEGLRMYAWWKDGLEYVGTCGTTLAAAIARALKEIE